MSRMRNLNRSMLMPGRAGRSDALRSESVEKGSASSTKPWKKKRRYLARMRRWLKKRERSRLALSTQQLARKSAHNIKEADDATTANNSD